MNHAIQISRVFRDSTSISNKTRDSTGKEPNEEPLTLSELFHSGFSVLTGTVTESGYGDVSSPTPLEVERNIFDPLVGIVATRNDDILARLCVYDAHLPLLVEDDFGHILSVFRQKENEHPIFFIDKLVVGKKLVNDIRTVGKLVRSGFEFVMEKQFSMVFTCVPPILESFYKEFIGCRELGRTNSVSVLKRTPGVFLYATPKTLNIRNISRL